MLTTRPWLLTKTKKELRFRIAFYWGGGAAWSSGLEHHSRTHAVQEVRGLNDAASLLLLSNDLACKFMTCKKSSKKRIHVEEREQTKRCKQEN